MEFVRQSEYRPNNDERTESGMTEDYDRNTMSGDEKNEYAELEKELREQKKPKKPLARVIPAFIDLIIIGAQFVVFVGFLYMAYIYGDLHQNQCVANAYLTEPLSENTNTWGVNVTRRFRIAIRWGFWMSLLNISRSVLAYVALNMKSWLMLYTSYVLFAVNFTLMLVLFIFMNMWRWDMPGRVCSGEYLTPD